MDINTFLQYLLYGGGSVATVSFLVERWTWFQKQTVNAKQWISFGFSAVLGVGAYAVVTYVPVSVVSQVNPFFVILSSIFGVYFLGQVFHTQDNTSK